MGIFEKEAKTVFKIWTIMILGLIVLLFLVRIIIRVIEWV